MPTCNLLFTIRIPTFYRKTSDTRRTRDRRRAPHIISGGSDRSQAPVTSWGRAVPEEEYDSSKTMSRGLNLVAIMTLILIWTVSDNLAAGSPVF